MKKPNLILFNPDQWRGDVLGHLGNPAAVTPNLDQLVQTDAVSFSRAFCQNPVCMPSRSSFLTGVYPHTWGKRTFTHDLHPERGEPNLLKELKKAGYHVWWSGKNDVIAGQVPGAVESSCSVRFQPTEADYARHGHKMQPRYRTDWRGEKDSDSFFSFYVGKYDTEGDDIYCDRDWVDIFEAVDLIRNWDSDQPFCLFMALEMPHPDYGVEDPWFSMIDRNKLPPRVKDLPEGAPLGVRRMRELQNMESWSEERWSELRATYYGMCARVDHQLGLLIGALKDSGQYDDTAIFCFSDHGDYAGDYGLVQKHFIGMDDCLTRVPLVIKPPRSAGVDPRVSPALTELIDMTETVYAYADIDPAYRRFGKNLAPLIAGTSDKNRTEVYCESGISRGQPEARQMSTADFQRELASPDGPFPYWAGSSSYPLEDPVPFMGKVTMVRTERFKLVLRLYEPDSFFDLQADPMEMRNLIDAPEHQAEIQRLKNCFMEWQWETDSTVPFERDGR